MSPERSVGVNESIRTSDGFQITAVLTHRIPRARPGKTSYHEAVHIVAAEANGTSVVKATVIPGDGYLGLTQLSKPDAIAAIAPYALGCDGTGHDEFIVSSLGVDMHAASSAAKGILASRHEQIQRVASVLEEDRTIGNYDIRDAIDKAENGEEITVFIRDPHGMSQTHTGIRTKESCVEIPSDWIQSAVL